MEDGLDEQCAFNSTIGVDARSTAPIRPALITPNPHRILVDPEGDTAAVHQCMILIRPVSNVIPKDKV